MKGNAANMLMTVGWLAKLAGVVAALTLGIFFTAPVPSPDSAEPRPTPSLNATSAVPNLADLALDKPVEAPALQDPAQDSRAQVEALQQQLALAAAGVVTPEQAEQPPVPPDALPEIVELTPSQQRQQALDAREQNPTRAQVDALRHELAATYTTQAEQESGTASVLPPPSQEPAQETAPPALDPRVANIMEQKQHTISAEEAKLDMQRQAMEEMREDVDQRLQELKDLQASLNEVMTALEEAKEFKKQQGDALVERENKIGQLTKLMGNMRPPAAAAVLEKLDDYMVAEIIGRLQARVAGKFMAALRPDQAARIGEIMSKQDKVREAGLQAQAAAQRAEELSKETARLAESQAGASGLLPSAEEAAPQSEPPDQTLPQSAANTPPNGAAPPVAAPPQTAGEPPAPAAAPTPAQNDANAPTT